MLNFNKYYDMNRFNIFCFDEKYSNVGSSCQDLSKLSSLKPQKPYLKETKIKNYCT